MSPSIIFGLSSSPSRFRWIISFTCMFTSSWSSKTSLTRLELSQKTGSRIGKRALRNSVTVEQGGRDIGEAFPILQSPAFAFGRIGHERDEFPRMIGAPERRIAAVVGGQN